MGRRILQLACLSLTAVLVVPLALAQPPAEPAPATPEMELPALPPVEAEPPPVLLPPPEDKAQQPAAPGPNTTETPKAEDVPAPGASPARPDKDAKPGVPKKGTPGKPKAKILNGLKSVLGAGASAAEPKTKSSPVRTEGDAPASFPLDPNEVRDMPAVPGLPKLTPETNTLPQVPLRDGAARDAQLQKSQGAALGGGDALAPAIEPTGKPASASAAAAAVVEADSFVLSPDQLPLGRQAIGLTVDVVSPQFLNLNQEASLKIIVRNTGTTDARGVVVRDKLPDALQFQNSQPSAQPAAGSSLLVWHLGTVAAGSERVIIVRAVPTKVDAFDHAATVTMQAGGKARTIVREPKLKVEQKANSIKVLKGQPVEFSITISNTGNGPARKVNVLAKLSPGLRHESSGTEDDQNLFTQEIDLLEPGQRVVLDTLVTDTKIGGEQSCTVSAESIDVTTALDDARNISTVTVVEPKLKMTIAGPDKRYTETDASYDITVENPGTATARKVRVLASLPVNGRLFTLPPNAQFDKNTRKLVWTLPQLDPTEKTTLSFAIKMGGIGLYQVAAEARAEGGLHDKGTKSTDVVGIADVDISVTAKKRVVDVGDLTEFQIRLKNVGTKEATHLLIQAKYSDNLVPVRSNIEGNEELDHNPEQRLLKFPLIERVSANKETVMYVTVRALGKPGQSKPERATFRIYLLHDDLTKEEMIDDSAFFLVTPPRKPGP